MRKTRNYQNIKNKRKRGNYQNIKKREKEEIIKIS